MNRRAFVAGSLACLAAPLVAEAQQAGKVARVGLLSVGLAVPSEEIASSPLLTSLRDLGWIAARTSSSNPGLLRARPIGFRRWRLT